MAITNEYGFTLSRSGIIQQALTKLAILSEGEEMTSDMVARGSSALNLLIKSWQAKHSLQWALEVVYVFPDITKNRYLLGSDGDYACTENDLIKTKLSQDVGIGSDTITIDSFTNIQDKYFIGIVQNNNVIHWSTVNGTPLTNTISIANVTTAAATKGNKIYCFAKKINRPLRVKYGKLIIGDYNESPLQPIAMSDYENISNKSLTGAPSQYYYQSTLGLGTLKIYPQPSTVSNIIRLVVDRSLSDVKVASDNIDFPQEWEDTIIWNLAYHLAFEYGIPNTQPQLMTELKELAQKTESNALRFDGHNASIQLSYSS